MTRRRTAIATEWLTPVDSLQKQAAPRCVHTLRSPGMSKEYRLNSMTIKNSEEQRETAKNSQPRRCFFDASLSKTHRISAEESRVVADNSLQVQQKQRTGA